MNISDHFSQSLGTISRLKILKFFVNSVLRIRDGKIQIQDPGWKNPDPGSGMEALDARFFLLKFKICDLQDCPGTLVASTSYQPVMTKL